jgi:cytoskeletal protein CcmA (bactofilin family)/DNA-directed RNA polymerase subunit RPC12/RpoP
MFSRKPNLHDVECPHCHAMQSESIAAISTNCRACGRYFKLGQRAEARAPRAPKDMREVVCVKCGAMNLVPTVALSTQCTRCSHYLELGNKVIKGVQTAKIHAYDDVLFAEGCSFKGMEATGRHLEVRGKVFSKLRAMQEISAMPGSSISGELHAPVVRIERGADVKVQVLECDRLLVSGAVEISGRLAAGEIVLNDGATFSGRLNIPKTKLRISSGASVQFDSIHCEGLIVEGTVTLGTALMAETVFVMNGGTLHAPAIRAARVEVSPGSFLEARIEKYLPPEPAVEDHPPQPEPEPVPTG